MGLAGQNGFPKGLVTNDYNTCSRVSGSLKTSSATARPFSAAASAPSSSACRATTSTTRPPTPPFAYNPGVGTNVYFSKPSTSWVHGQSHSGCPCSRPASPTWRRTTAPAVAQFSLGVQHEMSPSIDLGCAVCRQPGVASEHRAPHQQLPASPPRPLTDRAARRATDAGKYAGDQYARTAR